MSAAHAPCAIPTIVAANTHLRMRKLLTDKLVTMRLLLVNLNQSLPARDRRASAVQKSKRREPSPAPHASNLRCVRQPLRTSGMIGAGGAGVSQQVQRTPRRKSFDFRSSTVQK